MNHLYQFMFWKFLAILNFSKVRQIKSTQLASRRATNVYLLNYLNCKFLYSNLLHAKTVKSLLRYYYASL